MSRVLDGLFAERVMGLTLFDKVSQSDGLATYRAHEPKCYTTDLTAAWGGVEKLGWCELTGPWLGRPESVRYQAIVDPRPQDDDNPLPMESVDSDAASPALAVVLACLRAVGVSEEEIAAAQGEVVDV